MTRCFFGCGPVHIYKMTNVFFVLRGSNAPLGSEYDEEEVDYEESDSDESWTTESAISSESILSSMCMNGGEEKPFACPVPGCKKRYKVRLDQRINKSSPTTGHEVSSVMKSTLKLFIWYHMSGGVVGKKH